MFTFAAVGVCESLVGIEGWTYWRMVGLFGCVGFPTGREGLKYFRWIGVIHESAEISFGFCISVVIYH